jgi:hypothetical protein
MSRRRAERGRRCRLAGGAFPDGPPADRQRVVRHLLAGCTGCRAGVARRFAPAPAAALDAAIERVAARSAALVRRVAAERRAADALLARAASFEPPGQRLFLANCPPPHRRAVCELLVERARAQRHVSAAETLRLAELAVAVGELLAPEEGAATRARAWAELGNARRIVSDLAGAEEALGRAEELIDNGGGDPLLRAEVLSLRGSVAQDERRFGAAIQHLRHSARLYAQCGDDQGRARVLIQLGLGHAVRGYPAKGVAPAFEAFKIAHAAEDTHLKLIAAQSVIYLAAESGDAYMATTLIREARPVFELAAPRLDRLRFDWLAARVDSDQGLWGAAAHQLAGLRKSYGEEGLPYEVALVSLDLAGVYARQERRRDLRELLGETAELFRRLGIGRETLAALTVLAQAERSQAAALIRHLAGAVESARRAARRPTGSPDA